MTNIRRISCNSYNFFLYFINGLKIKVCSSKLAMGYLHHAVTLLVVDLKRLQPITLTIKQTSTHKYFRERKSSRNHRWSRQQDNHRIPIFWLDHNSDDQASNDMNHKPKQDGRMIWLDQIRRPIWLHCMSHFSVLTCHFPFWQMRRRRWAGYPSDRWSTGPTASPALLSAVVTWNVLPFFLLQWNLSWVKDKTDLSSFMAVFVRTIWSLVIPRYEVLTGSWEGGVEPITMLETRSHPPEMKSCFLIRKNNRL